MPTNQLDDDGNVWILITEHISGDRSHRDVEVFSVMPTFTAQSLGEDMKALDDEMSPRSWYVELRQGCVDGGDSVIVWWDIIPNP